MWEDRNLRLCYTKAIALPTELQNIPLKIKRNPNFYISIEIKTFGQITIFISELFCFIARDENK